MNLIAVSKSGPPFVADKEKFVADKGIACWDYRSTRACAASYHVYVYRKLTKDQIEQYRQMARDECRRQHPHHEPRIVL